MGKMVVLKPVIWNSGGYQQPTGETQSTGFAGQHGYGHEEWNGRSDWIWKSWKVFHTQGKGRMFDYAERGDLGIVMTTMKDGKFYAVGVACAVYRNTAEDCAEITRDLNLFANGKQLWKLESVRNRKASKAEFDRHWRQAHAWVEWRCPQSHFVWFNDPIPFIPNDVIPSEDPDRPREATVKMHGSYQAVRPDQALAIIDEGLPASHPVRAWLATEDFDPVRNTVVRNAPPPKRKSDRRSAATPTDPQTRYLQEYELQITPKHHLLQSAFEAFLRKSKVKRVDANINRVDVSYDDARLGPVLAEIKPADAQTVRFAIRAAIGQLLDYRQMDRGEPAMLVVVGCEPQKSADLELALNNGFGIAWPAGKGFEIRWPPTEF